MPKSIKNIYLDYAASAMPNPSSIHREGIFVKKKLENARRQVAEILFVRPEEIIFTSGGTEGNNLAIQGIVLASQVKKPHIITTNIEHPSVLETCKLLEKRRLTQISIVPVEASGIINPKKIRQAIKENTVLVSVMYANNEIGTIQPIKEIAKEIKNFNKINSKKILFHTDAVQAVNYLDLNVEKLGVDLLTLSGSKIPGAGRVGVLYKKKTVPLAPIFGGGDQEGGLRPGTENLPEILKFAQAFTAAGKIKDEEAKRLLKLRDYFVNRLNYSTILTNSRIVFNGDLGNRLPNNINITFPKIPSDLLVIELSARGVMCSSKSACKSLQAEGSYVIKALRPDADPEIGGLRFSFGRATKKEDIDYTVQCLTQILTKLKKWYN